MVAAAVRVLPWINYDDFMRSEFNAYLKARRDQIKKSSPQAKTDVVTVTRRDISLVERYVKAREAQGGDARPSLDYIDEDICRESERLKERLAAIAIGRSDAERYQQLVLEILNLLFNPELIDGQPEVKTIDGTERREAHESYAVQRARVSHHRSPASLQPWSTFPILSAKR